MASLMTNKAKYRILGMVLNNTTEPANYYAYLINSGTPTNDTNTWSELSAGKSTNYVTNPLTLTPNSTDFPSLTEDDTDNEGEVNIKPLVFTASGGNLSGTWVIITDDNGTEANREVYFALDLGGTQQVSDGQTLTVSNTLIKIT